MQNLVFLVLSWLYVIARVIHAYIHIGVNNVLHRMFVYTLSWAVLAVMWVLILIKALSVSAL
ncbi:MAPEG family protein [compost metagenome]